MGLFSWLFGGAPKVAVADRVWLTDAALRAAVGRDLAGRSGTALLLAHFPATLAAVRADLDARGVTHAPFPAGLTPPQLLRAADAAGPLLLAGLVRDLRPDEFPAADVLPGTPIPVVVAERHLLRTHDDAVVRFAEGLGDRARVMVHASLDAPLMALFAGEWVRTTLRKLGLKEDEPIASALVTRRVKAAQNQLAAQATGDRPADSADELVRLNLGDG